MEKGTVFEVKRGAIHDGPGIRTTVFLKGCPLDCRWCHNPEGKSPKPVLAFVEQRCIGCGACAAACPAGAIAMQGGVPETDRTRCTACGKCADVCPTGAREILGRSLSVAELLAELERDRPFYEASGGGVTFSGGEPFSQPDFLFAALKACRERGIHTAVDTSGYAPRELLLRAAELVDLFLYDLKDMDPRRHRETTGVPLEPILANLRALDSVGATIWVRIPLIPGFNDGPETVEAYIRFLSRLNGEYPVFLLPYHPVGEEKYRRLGLSYPLAGLKPPSREQIEEVEAAFAAAGFEVRIGG